MLCGAVCCVVLCCAVLCCVALRAGCTEALPSFRRWDGPICRITADTRTHTPQLRFSLNEENSAAARLNAVTWGRGGKKKIASWNDPRHWLLYCCVIFFFSTPPAQHRVAFLFSPSGPFFFPPLGWASVPMMISKVKNAMSTLVGGMMPHGHHHHHNHHSGGGQTCGPDSLPPRFPYGRPDFLDLTPELLQYSTEHASRPVLTLKRDSRLHWRTGYAEWVARSGHWWKRPPLLLKKSFNIRRYYDCFCMRLQSWWDSGLWCSSSQCTAAAKWWWPTWPFAVVHFFFCLPRCSPLLHDTCVCAQALHKTSPDICVHWSLTEALHQVLISIWCKSERRKCLYLLMLTNTPLCVNVLPLWAFWYLTHTKK